MGSTDSIGTEMEGLILDPFGADFEKSEIERLDGDKIYLIPR